MAEHPLRTGGPEIKLNGEQMETQPPGALRGAPGASAPALELLAPHHARLLARSGAAAEADDAASGRAGASGASATFLSMRVCRRPAPSHARLLAGRPCTARAALPRVEVVVARMLACRAPRRTCVGPPGAAESGFIGRRRRLGRELSMPPFERTRASNVALK